jgi:hypothetical protein
VTLTRRSLVYIASLLVSSFFLFRWRSTVKNLFLRPEAKGGSKLRPVNLSYSETRLRHCLTRSADKQYDQQIAKISYPKTGLLLLTGIGDLVYVAISASCPVLQKKAGGLYGIEFPRILSGP